MNVLIADKFPESAVANLRDCGLDVVVGPELKDEALAHALTVGHHRVLVVRSTRVTGAMIAAAPELKLIVRAGSGFDTIDVDAATARGVRVCNCPGKNSVAVAELTIGLMIALDRRIVDETDDLRRGVWNKRKYGQARGLKGRTLGIVGLGRIGYEVAKRAAAVGRRASLRLSPVVCHTAESYAWTVRLDPNPSKPRGSSTMSDATDTRMNELAEQLDERDALDDRLIELLKESGTAQAKMHAVRQRCDAFDREIDRLEKTGLGTLVTDLLGGRRLRDLRVKRELRAGAMAELAECESAVETAHVKIERIQREVRGYQDVETEYEELAGEKLRRIAEEDRRTAERIGRLHAEVVISRGNHDVLTHAMNDGVAALKGMADLARSLVATGKNTKSVRSRGILGFMMGGPILAALFAASAARKRSTRNRANIGPVRTVRAALDRLGETLGKVHWDSRLTADCAIDGLMRELAQLHARMSDDFAVAAAGKPAIALHLGGLIDALMHNLYKKESQEWAQLRRVRRDWRFELAAAQTPQAA